MDNIFQKLFFIAECGHSHNGNIRLAKEMIWEAKSCGANAVKFQLYDTDKIKKYYQSRYSELKWAELSKEDLTELKETADKAEIDFIASAFDVERVGWLEEIGVKIHKLASRSIYDQELIKAMEATNKPIIASLGQWKFELEEGLNSVWPHIQNVQFLYCVSDYPAHITNDIFPKDFTKYAGFSDHTIGMEWTKEAVRRGAKIIEKHFTLDKHLPGYDQWGSADPTDAKDFYKWLKNVK